MRFDRLEIEGRESGVGELYWLDLRLIREAKGIAMRTVHERTRVPIEILSSFEEEGLNDRRRFNSVYRRSLAAAYARAIEIDPDDVLRSAEESELGRYRGRLASNYLGVEPPPRRSNQRNGLNRRDDVAIVSDRKPDDLDMRMGNDVPETHADSQWDRAVGPLARRLSDGTLHVVAGIIAALLVLWILAAVL